eukprot:TRINITY_DN3338_c1_g1_i10.p1 TRINITY_DN3338_c1_g1~~TRINITY_DN3338_c1_g1_i10.p1  ORF type:complete len:313 (-),score=26.13 TRINITY_DN3338_c1_g1_i10:100-984(-)
MLTTKVLSLFTILSVAGGNLFAVLMDEGGTNASLQLSSTDTCSSCVAEGMAWTIQGCQSSCLMDTWCYTSSCPELSDIDDCFQCHAFQGDYSIEAGCNSECPLDVSCYPASNGVCPEEELPLLLPITIDMKEAGEYDRFTCLSCLADGSVFTPSGCQEQCLMDTWCITSEDMCVSNCEMCVETEGKKLTPDGCKEECMMDTWCYTSECPAFQNITTCNVCDSFGGFYMEGEGCMQGDASYLPSQGCADFSQIDNCEDCVAKGGRYVGELSPDQQGLFCSSDCLFFLPVCLSECE